MPQRLGLPPQLPSGQSVFRQGYPAGLPSNPYGFDKKRTASLPANSLKPLSNKGSFLG